MSQTFKLYRLQQLDSQMDRIRSRLNEIDAALLNDDAVRQARAALEAAEAETRARTKVLQQAERQSQETRIKIEQSESTLYGGKVRNPKELQDLQNEAAALKRLRTTQEDRQLEVMMHTEEAEDLEKAARAALKQAEEQFRLNCAAWMDEQARVRKDLAGLEMERQATVTTISAEDLEAYNRLRVQRNGIAVAKVDGKACSACGTVLSSTLLQAARSPDHVARCTTCGRMLHSL